MKAHYRVLFLAILLLVGCAQKEHSPASVVQGEAPFDFRGTRWGMSQEEVKRSEAGKSGREYDEGIIYDEELFGENVGLGYAFKENKLIGGFYFLDETVGQARVENFFAKCMSHFHAKYGPPSDERTSKDGARSVRWKNENTYITLTIEKDQSKDFPIMISYGDRKLIEKQFGVK